MIARKRTWYCCLARVNRAFIAGTSCSLNRTQDKIYDKVQIQNTPPPSVCTAAPLLCRFLGKMQCLLGSSPLQNGQRWPSLLGASKPASEANRTSDKKCCKYKDQIHARKLDLRGSKLARSPKSRIIIFLIVFWNDFYEFNICFFKTSIYWYILFMFF